MKTVSFTAVDKNGVELSEGDIITSDYGTTTVVFFSEKLRCFCARDEAPFPCDIREPEISKYFWIIGNIATSPDFKPIYEREVHYERCRELEQKRKESSIWFKIKKTLKKKIKRNL